MKSPGINKNIKFYPKIWNSLAVHKQINGWENVVALYDGILIRSKEWNYSGWNCRLSCWEKWESIACFLLYLNGFIYIRLRNRKGMTGGEGKAINGVGNGSKRKWWSIYDTKAEGKTTRTQKDWWTQRDWLMDTDGLMDTDELMNTEGLMGTTQRDWRTQMDWWTWHKGLMDTEGLLDTEGLMDTEGLIEGVDGRVEKKDSGIGVWSIVVYTCKISQ